MNRHKLFRLIALITLFLALPVFAQKQGEVIDGEPGQSLGREIVSKRTSNSKTYLHAASNTFTTVASSGPMHYADSTGYEVRRGLYIAEFPIEFSDKAKMVSFETRDGLFFNAVPVELAYFDRQSKRLVTIEKAQRSLAVTDGNKIRYPNVFTGVDVEYEYMDKHLKQQIHLSQQARDRLPGLSRGLKAEDTDLVMVSRFAIPDDLEAFVGEEKKSSVGADNKVRVEHEGEDELVFRKNGQRKFRLLRDVAFRQASGDSALVDADLQPIWRRFYRARNQNFVLTGVPLTWLQAQQAGTIVLDPTVSLQPPTDDTWIEYNRSSNYSGFTQIRIGRGNGYGWKRSLVKFDISNIPEDATLQSADLDLYFYGKYGTNIINRTIQCHKVLKDWVEAQADWYERLNGTAWGTAGVAFDNVDAKSTAEDNHDWDDEYPTWKSYDITSLTQDWVDGTASNYGVIFWATDEDDYTNGDEKWVYSSEYTGDTSKRPKLVISYTVDPMVTYQYDAQSRPDTVTYGNGIVETNTYDIDRGWITRRDYKDGATNKFYFNNSGIDAVGDILPSQE